MPYVQHIPQGQNVSVIRDLADRLLDLEARRVAEGIAVQPNGTAVQKSAVIGSSGAAFLLSNGALVAVDGVTVQLPIVGAGNLGFEAFGLGVTGLTPGWHEFAIDGSVATVGWAFLSVWPI